MNRNILCFCIGFWVCAFIPLHAQQAATSTAKSKLGHGRLDQAYGDAGVSPAAAQSKNSVAEVTSSSETEINEVKDYKSFKKHVENEYEKIKVTPITIENGEVKGKLKKMGIVFAPNKNWANSKDNKKTAFSSPDKKGVAVIDATTRSINIFNPKGEIVRRIPFPKNIEGLIGFSDTRLFDFKGGFGDYEGGFYIYDLSGQLVKKVEDSGVVDVFMVSNNQKYVAVTAGFPETGDFFILYDMNGTELWRQKTVFGGNTKIQFSLDDKFVIVKMPVYSLDPRGEPKDRKLYIYKVEDGKLVSEEHYED